MKKTFAETFPSGEVRADVYSLTLANNTAKTNNYTVPDDTLWVLQSVRMTNPDDVQRTINMRLYKTSAKTSEIGLLSSVAAAAGAAIMYPNTGSGSATFLVPRENLVLFAGNTLEITWAAGGASSGGTDADGVVIFYRRLLKT